jgi:hypothetical protein
VFLGDRGGELGRGRGFRSFFYGERDKGRKSEDVDEHEMLFCRGG